MSRIVWETPLTVIKSGQALYFVDIEIKFENLKYIAISPYGDEMIIGDDLDNVANSISYYLLQFIKEEEKDKYHVTTLQYCEPIKWGLNPLVQGSNNTWMGLLQAEKINQDKSVLN